MPLGSGGFVISNIPQRTDWSLEYNAELARQADLGFEYMVISTIEQDQICRR